MARTVALAALLVLALSPVARAHVTVTPVQVETGLPHLLLVTLPNEDFQYPLVSIRLTLPPGATALSAEAVEGRWRSTVDDRVVELRGGPIAPGSSASFRLRARFDLASSAGVVVEERYAAFGQSARYTVPFTVTRATTTDGGVDTMVLVAIGIFGALAVSAGLAFLTRWLRR